METIVTRIRSGHTNNRRTIWDLIQRGDAGGGLPLYQLSWFDPVHSGAQIGGARLGFGHYHERMWETYLILSGSCVMSLKNIDTKTIIHETIDIKDGDAPWRIEIPPRVAHRLTAMTATRLLIAATGEQSLGDTFETELQLP